ncbi:hypothetical protein [Phenylobacterium sp.]|uniref:hypothetical protein n=1 Tax=Phenylobacterium sp. TaxID=1871053 RepID=UPI00391DF807
MPISSKRWESYPWKNELQLQMERAIAHGLEVLDDDFQGDHSPLDMMERAIVLSAFAIRRMVEKKLVTDAFAASKRSVRSFKAVSAAEFRPPFHGDSGGSAFSNYHFAMPVMIDMTTGELANEIIHSSQLMVVDGEAFAADGFLIASDWHLSRRVLHLSFAEFEGFVRSVLRDDVAYMSDQWNPETGRVSSARLGPSELSKLKR